MNNLKDNIDKFKDQAKETIDTGKYILEEKYQDNKHLIDEGKEKLGVGIKKTSKKAGRLLDDTMEISEMELEKAKKKVQSTISNVRKKLK